MAEELKEEEINEEDLCVREQERIQREKEDKGK